MNWKLLSERNIDVKGQNEARLESRVSDSIVNIENYQIYQKGRKTASGGVV